MKFRPPTSFVHFQSPNRKLHTSARPLWVGSSSLLVQTFTLYELPNSSALQTLREIRLQGIFSKVSERRDALGRELFWSAAFTGGTLKQPSLVQKNSCPKNHWPRSSLLYKDCWPNYLYNGNYYYRPSFKNNSIENVLLSTYVCKFCWFTAG